MRRQMRHARESQIFLNRFSWGSLFLERLTPIVRSRSKKRFDFGVQLLRNDKNFSVAVCLKKTRHSIIGEVCSIRTLINENRHGGVGACVRNSLRHSAHDTWVPDNKTQHARGVSGLSLGNDSPVIKP